MNEQRTQAYIELVQKLLNCADGEEKQLLQQSPELLDKGLVQVMEQAVAVLRQKGKEEKANKLGSIATDLTNEQRSQAYIELVQKLLNCADGEENQLLQQSPELLDKGLVQVMEQAVAVLRQKGENGRANKLEIIATDLSQFRKPYEKNAQVYTESVRQSALSSILDKLLQPPPQSIKGIQKHIKLYVLGLTLVSRTVPAFKGLQTELAKLCQILLLHPQGDRASNVETAIEACEHLLQTLDQKDDPTFWAGLMNCLGSAYRTRLQGDRAENIEVAIHIYEQSLQVITRKTMPMAWASAMTNLGNAYYFRIRGIRSQNLEKAITAYQQSTQVNTPEVAPVDWAVSMMNLANAYRDRIHGDRAQNLEDAIATGRQALEVITQETMPERWAQLMMNLGNAYYFRIREEKVLNIENAIVSYEQALKIITQKTMPFEWAQLMMNLSNAYRDRIRGDRAQNLEDAIATCQRSLQVRTKEAMPFEWAQSMTTLGSAYCFRLLGDRTQNIESAITIYKQSLQVVTQETMPTDWATTMMNLTNAYRDRILGDRAQNLEDAITTCQQALQVRTKEAMPFEWAQSMNNLGTAYFLRIQGDRAENIEDAINTYEQALQIMTREKMPVEWALLMMNLARAHVERIVGDRDQNLENAIRTYSQALEIFTPDAHPSNCRQTAKGIAAIHAYNNCWVEAQVNYHTALTAAENLYESALSKGSQEAELKETNDLYRRAAYTYAKVGDLKTAIATIERGRARSLSETLQRDRADLEAIRQIHPNLVENYETAANAIQLLESTERRISFDSNQPQYSPEDFRNQAVQARETLQDCLTEIRQIPGYESFLTLPTFDDIASTLQPNQSIIYLIPTPNGSLALMLNRSTHQPENEIGDESQTKITPIWLDDFTELNLQNLLTNTENNGWLDAYQNQGRDRATWSNTLNRTLQSLWQPILLPILRHLSQAKCFSVTLIPTGLLSLLPLHAAQPQDANGNRRYACDFIRFNYAPNTLSLNTARTIAAQTPATKLLAINDPQPTSSSPLPSSSMEIANAVSAFRGHGNWKILQHESASPTTVLDALPDYPVVHFACHGSANFQTPLNSGLLMANDAILSLRDLLDLKLKGLRLAILSACETGIPGTNLPDEVISLPTGLLQAGAAGVISSLWSVEDHSTMVLLSRFYELWQPQSPNANPLEPAEALHQAQKWLRNSTGPELAPYLQNSHPELAAKLEQAPDKRPFAHPFYWAAFSYMGV